MITIETQAANERFSEFMDKAERFQKQEKMSHEALAGYCGLVGSTWHNMRHYGVKSNAVTLIKISNATGIAI
jgi:hypothetical protein